MKKTVALAGALLILLGIPLQASALPVQAWPDSLIPMGQTAGVQFTSQGLMVVGYTQLPETAASPAQDGGLQIGDFITHINQAPIQGAQSFQEMLNQNGETPIMLSVSRRGNKIQVPVTPEYSQAEKTYKIGAWIRDNISGIGTLTFYDPNSGVFGALGHGINDSNTKLLIPIANGSLLCSQVVEVRRGQTGQPGELKGSFEQQTVPGSLLLNSTNGLFGILEQPEQFNIQQAIPTARNHEVTTGKAVMLSNVHGKQVEAFDIEIVRIFEDNQPSRNFMIKVTDPDLIAQTGGIVQGMSGSPILQNGKFVGATTHVLVSDPKRGYGIFIDNMLSEIYGNAPAISLEPSKAA